MDFFFWALSNNKSPKTAHRRTPQGPIMSPVLRVWKRFDSTPNTFSSGEVISHSKTRQHEQSLAMRYVRRFTSLATEDNPKLDSSFIPLRYLRFVSTDV